MKNQSYASLLREDMANKQEKKDCCKNAYASGYEGTLPEFICDNDINAYIRGVFVRCGTLTDPEKEYLLELKPTADAEFVKETLEKVELKPDITYDRTGKEKLYYRNSRKIEDFLAFIGAGKYALDLMDTKITKELRNKANRTANAETANFDRAAVASAEQVLAVKTLIKCRKFKTLSPELRESGICRLKYPDVSLAILAEKHDNPVSKSGLSHRLKKLTELAKKCSEEMRG